MIIVVVGENVELLKLPRRSPLIGQSFWDSPRFRLLQLRLCVTIDKPVSVDNSAMATKYTCRRCLVAIQQSSSLSSRSGRSSKAWLSDSFPTSTKTFRASLSTNRRLQKPEVETDLNKRVYRNLPYQHLDVGDVQQGNSILRPDNLFHSFSKSPSPAIRKKAAYIKQHAYCPHPDHRQTRMPSYGPDDPESRKPASGGIAPAHAKFECPDCGIPLYCSEEHWMDDYEAHLEVCEVLKTINEDEHDLRSGRFFSEFEYPGPQYLDDFLINMMNWDTLLWTREFKAINNDMHQRQATRLLTYPATIGSVLHELSPYTVKSGERLTPEGLRSLSGKHDFHRGFDKH